ncbi:hypothetical protein CBL_11996 [Carabus blaptoides fortunei]
MIPHNCERYDANAGDTCATSGNHCPETPDVHSLPEEIANSMAPIKSKKCRICNDGSNGWTWPLFCWLSTCTNVQTVRDLSHCDTPRTKQITQEQQRKTIFCRLSIFNQSTHTFTIVGVRSTRDARQGGAALYMKHAPSCQAVKMQSGREPATDSTKHRYSYQLVPYTTLPSAANPLRNSICTQTIL